MFTISRRSLSAHLSALAVAATLTVGLASCATDATTSPRAVAAWTYCTDAGSSCDFLGLRDVRFGGKNGPYVQLTAYHTVPCATYAFGNQVPDTTPGAVLHCDYGPFKTAALTNPRPGMVPINQSSVTVPLGAPGVDTAQRAPTTEQPQYTDGSGSFRTTCSLSKFAFDDPVVFPGQPGASHLHAFFGNTGVNANSTVQSIAGTGGSTCRGGILNRTAYWVPAMIDTRTGQVQLPDEGVFYYKTGYNIDPTVVKPLPAGLRMIAGNKLATSVQDYAMWGCKNLQIPNDGTIPTTCPVGDFVRLTVFFPQCWDGVHLDSPDHQSHMAYPIYRNPPQVSTCPADHPVTLPAITEHFDYPITATAQPQYWRLSSDMYSTSLRGGFSAHADWFGGWDTNTMATIVSKCLNKAVDCGVGSIGDGTTLY